MSIHLSPREREVCVLVARGDQYKTVARKLGISIDTVRTYVGRIAAKQKDGSFVPREAVIAVYYRVVLGVDTPEEDPNKATAA